MAVIDTTNIDRYPVDTLQRTMDWFEEARPTPTRKDFHNQLGVHFEEVSEMVEEIRSCDDAEIAILLDETLANLRLLAKTLKERSDEELVFIPEENLIRYLDALCDQTVTATGCAQTIDGMDFVGAMKAVNTANFSKFVDGKALFDANGKIQKGPNYVKADLSPFIASRTKP